MDAMLKGLAAWKSAAGRGLLRWGFVVLHKAVGKRDGVLWGLLYWKTGLPEGQDVVRPWARCHNLTNPSMGGACDALTLARGYTVSTGSRRLKPEHWVFLLGAQSFPVNSLCRGNCPL